MRVLNFDPEVFGPNAADFDPARYLDENGRVRTLMEGRDEGHMSFGFGRRVCPGKYVAEVTLTIDFATLLWAMRFEHPEGSQGDLDVHTPVQSAVTAYVFLRPLLENYVLIKRHSRPVPFQWKAVPRFMEAEALLNEALSVYE